MTFKNCVAISKCTTKIDETATDDVEGLDLDMAMHNSIEYSSNYSDITDNLWFYSKDEAIMMLIL